MNKDSVVYEPTLNSTLIKLENCTDKDVLLIERILIDTCSKINKKKH